MPISFPSNPSTNDTYTVNGRTYIWTGEKWRRNRYRIEYTPPTMDVSNDFSAGGALHVDASTGRIGIGTSTPATDLHVDGNVEFTGTLDVTGLITSATATAVTNDTTVATTAYVQTALAGLVDSAPSTLDTLNELAAALGDDANFATTITNSIATKQDASTALTTSTTFGGDVSGTYNAIVIADDSHTHDGRYFTETEADGRYLGISAKAADSNLFDGLDSTVFTRKNGSITSQDWNTYATGDVSSFTGVSNMTGSTKPPAYAYGLAVHYSSSGQGKLQIYAPHNGSDGGNGLWFRSGWNTEYDAWSEIWHSRNDGSGSGLDADLLDGNHASAFATSGHTHSYAATTGSASNDFNIKVAFVNEVAADDGSASDVSYMFKNDTDSGMYRAGSGDVRISSNGTWRLQVNGSGSYTNGRIYTNSYYGTAGGNAQVIMSGTNQAGALYVGGGGNNNASTGAIEASWRNTLNPSIAIGVSRDYDRTRFEAAYNGYAIIYVDNTERLRCTTGGVTYNGSFGASSIRIKENVRDASSVDGYTPADRNTALDKLLSLRPVVYDLKEHAHDKLWVGCDVHSHRFECEEAECENDRVNRVEHVCGQGWCYGTLESPCPKYTGTRNKLHFIAEEVHEVYGDHGVGFNEMREVESVDHQSLYTEHINVTQHLIKYVRELEQRIAELEAV